MPPFKSSTLIHYTSDTTSLDLLAFFGKADGDIRSRHCSRNGITKLGMDVKNKNESRIRIRGIRQADPAVNSIATESGP